MSNNLGHLKSCELFNRLSPAQTERIKSRSRSRLFPAHSPVYLPAEKADSVFFLVQGLVKVCHLTADGKESILAFVVPGELFGEQSIFDGGERDECVKTVAPSIVVMIPAAEVRHLMSERADIALGITKMISLRRQRVERRLKNLLFLPCRERLVHVLLDLAHQFGWRSDEGIRLRVKLSHQELANLIGSTRETVTVILGQLKAEGSVDGHRCKVLLTNQLLAQCVN